MFPKLTDDKKYRFWDRQVRVIARAQNLQKVLDTDYVPTTQEEKDMFEIQNNSMTTVFVTKCKTQKSVAIVKQHEESGDAQACYQQLHKEYLTGTIGELAVNDALDELRDLCLDDGWTKKKEAFLTTWTNKRTDYEQIACTTLPEVDAKRYFKYSVRKNKEMYAQITHTETLERVTGTKLAWDQYWEMMTSIAQNEDALTHETMKKRRANQANQKKRFNQTTDEVDWEELDVAQLISRAKEGWVPSLYFYKIPQDTRNAIVKERKENKDGTVRKANKSNQDRINDSLEEDITEVKPEPEREPERGSTMRAFLSESQNAPGDTITVNGRKYKACKTEVLRRFPRSSQPPNDGSLIDRGANCGVWGSEGRVLNGSRTEKADVSGLLGHTVTDMPVGTVACKVQSNKGPIIAIFHQYLLSGEGSTIHSCLQLEAYGHHVEDQVGPMWGGVERHLRTKDGFMIPLTVSNGLVHMEMSDYDESEFEKLPHVTMTSEGLWDPTQFDRKFCEFEDGEDDVPGLSLRGDVHESDSEDEDHDLPDLISISNIPEKSRSKGAKGNMYIPWPIWKKMSWEQKRAHISKRSTQKKDKEEKKKGNPMMNHHEILQGALIQAHKNGAWGATQKESKVSSASINGVITSWMSKGQGTVTSLPTGQLVEFQWYEPMRHNEMTTGQQIGIAYYMDDAIIVWAYPEEERRIVPRTELRPECSEQNETLKGKVKKKSWINLFWKGRP